MRTGRYGSTENSMGAKIWTFSWPYLEFQTLLGKLFFSTVFIGEPLGPRVSEAIETPLLNGCLLLQLVCGQINLW